MILRPPLSKETLTSTFLLSMEDFRLLRIPILELKLWVQITSTSMQTMTSLFKEDL